MLQNGFFITFFGVKTTFFSSLKRFFRGEFLKSSYLQAFCWKNLQLVGFRQHVFSLFSSLQQDKACSSFHMFSDCKTDHQGSCLREYRPTRNDKLVKCFLFFAPLKTNMTGWKTHRLKMYFLLKMGNFQSHVTLPETNIAPEISKKLVFQPSIFRGELLVSGRVVFRGVPSKKPCKMMTFPSSESPLSRTSRHPPVQRR